MLQYVCDTFRLPQVTSTDLGCAQDCAQSFFSIWDVKMEACICIHIQVKTNHDSYELFGLYR